MSRVIPLSTSLATLPDPTGSVPLLRVLSQGHIPVVSQSGVRAYRFGTFGHPS